MASTAEAGTFKPEQLPDASTHIRLIKVVSVDQARDIAVHCELTTWLAAAAPEYTAISYTWGDPKALATILVNGKRMQVRRNCEDVLRQQCWRKGGYYWVDAICINQDDNNEKSVQVAKMGEIFRDARQTLACVGGPDEASGILFKTLRRPRLWYAWVGRDDENARRHYRLWTKLTPKSTRERLDNALKVLFGRSYFQRAWIYQELFFGNDTLVCCGDESIQVSLIWSLYEAIGTWADAPYKAGDGKLITPTTRVGSSYTYRSMYGDVNEMSKASLRMAVMNKKPSKFKELVPALRHLQCEDARDRVFGTSAMIDWEDKLPIEPDYGKDPFDLAVEVLHRIDYSQCFFSSMLSDTIRVAHLMGLPDKPSRRLEEEIHARRARAPPTDTTRGGQTACGGEAKFLFCQIYWGKAGWYFPNSLHASRNCTCIDGSNTGAGGPTHELRDSRTLTIHKWSKGTAWDVHKTDILLPEETRPQDWLLIPSQRRLPLGPYSPIAFVARNNSDGHPQLVGKALFNPNLHWRDPGTSPYECIVGLDYEDRIVLAYSCKWRPFEGPFSSIENEPHLLQVDDYFEIGIRSETSKGYAEWTSA